MAPVNPRPRPYAEHPAGPLAPKPANDNVLGNWENGVFRFASAEAKEKWRRKSFEQGVGEENWHHGKAIDSKSAAIAQAGLGGANPGLYQAPDGTYRLMNAKTIESQEARDHRNKYLTGKTIDQIAAANTMPGADEWVAKGKAGQGATNAADAVMVAQAQLPESSSAERAELPKALPRADQGAGRMMVGRFGAMKPALESSDKQSADDIGRIVVNSVLGNYGDEVRAGAGAISAWWDGKSFGEAYDSALPKEKAESAAAQERQGLTGTGVEILTSFIPIVGDLSGAAADFKDWKEHGDDWGWKDYGLVAAGLLPGMVNRRAAKKAKKALDDILEDGRAAEKDGAGELLKPGSEGRNDLDQYLPSNETKPLTQGQAEALTGRNRGLIYVTETFPGKEPAKIFHDGTSGAFSSVEHKRRVVPALRYDNPDGKNFIKFDGIEAADDGSHLLLIDAKRSLPIWRPSAMSDLKDTLERIKKAVHQNNADGLNGVQYQVVYEFPNSYSAKVAAMFLAGNGYGDLISVRVRQ